MNSNFTSTSLQISAHEQGREELRNPQYFSSFFYVSLFFLCLFFISPHEAFAQDSGGAGVYEMGFDFGRMLPNQISDASEIFPQWGLRAGYGSLGEAFYEAQFHSGSGEGISWNQLSVSLRMDSPLETFWGSAYLGFDVINYTGTTGSKHTTGGGHFGGALLSLVSKDLWFRADMKFNINPGTSLYIGAGFVFRFGAASGTNSGT